MKVKLSLEKQIALHKQDDIIAANKAIAILKSLERSDYNRSNPVYDTLLTHFRKLMPRKVNQNG
jgi:hypothetical protein